MERYDAILEQLRQAQGRGMDTITNRLDVVVQSLEELIHEAKSSVQGALPESANELLPVDEIEAALDTYRQEADSHQQRCAELEAKIGVLEQTAEHRQEGTSITLMRALDGAASQSELLKELLPAISEHAARAVVLVLRDGKVSAWSGIGFADGEVLRSWQGDVAESPALSKLLEISRPVRFTPTEDSLFQGWFAQEVVPHEILLIPVVLRGKLMGTVYVDRLEDHPWNPDTTQTLVAQVCWLIDTLQYRQSASASLAEPVEIGQVSDAVVPEAAPAEEETAAEPVIEVEAPVVEEEVPEAEPEAAPTAEPDDETHEPEIDPSATMKIDVSGLSDSVSEDEVVAEAAEEIERQAEVITAGIEPEESTAPESEESVEPETAEEPETDAGSFEPEAEPESFEPETAEEPEADTESFEPEAEPESFEPETTEEPETEPESFEPESTEIATETEFEPESDSGFEPGPASDFEPETESDVADDVAAEETAEAKTAPPETVEVPSAVQMPVTPPEPEAPPEEESENSGSQFLDEPPPVQPVQPPPAAPEEEVSEDEAQREEARRFARLLVSEIKLYNEEQVERGRESKDIYRRLQEDIDRSREMFDKRISAEVRESQDYFQDELVRVLADGDPDLLGM